MLSSTESIKSGKQLLSFDHAANKRTVNPAYFTRSTLIKKIIM